MYKICTICARGGSRGVPGKNTMLLEGKPLIAHTIDQAKESRLFSAIAVSSDSDQILSVAQEYGAIPIERPAALATDTAAKLPAIKHCVETLEAQLSQSCDIIVDLDATSPLRAAADIAACVEMVVSGGADNVITASPARRSPYFNMVELDDAKCPRLIKTLPKAVVRRQDSPACFDMNASIYVWRRQALFEVSGLFTDGTRLHVMPEERSVDIDSPLDLEIVKMIMQQKNTGQKTA